MKQLFSACLLAVVCSVPLPAFAQDTQSSDTIGAAWELSAEITGPTDIAVGRTIILDASSSNAIGENVQYLWYVNNASEPVSRTVEALYTPERAGILNFRLVLRSRIDGAEREERALHTVTAYDRKIVLVTDGSVSTEDIKREQRAAAASGVYLRVIQPDSTGVPLGVEDTLSRLLSEQSAAFQNAETIVLWTDSVRGVQALLSASQQADELRDGIRNQTVILLTEHSLGTIARTARGLFSVLDPKRIFLTRPGALPFLISAKESGEFMTSTEQNGIDILLIDKSDLQVQPWHILSPLVTYMLAHGIPSETILLLLLLPIIATILTFLKQVIGVTTFGLFTPSIIVLSFIALGWIVGVVFLLFIIAAGYLTRAFMQRWRLLYIPKVAIILTVVTFTLLLLLGIGSAFDIRFPRETIFVLLIMSTLAESFMNLKAEEGMTSAVFGVGETILAALLCVFIVQTPLLQSIVLAYPEVIFLTIGINIFLGRWTGLRLVEYFRFREVFKHLQEE